MLGWLKNQKASGPKVRRLNTVLMMESLESRKLLTGSPGFQLIETDGDTRVNEGGTIDTFEVVLTSMPTAPVFFDIYSDNWDESDVYPDFLVFEPEDWNIPQVVEVFGVNDYPPVQDGDQLSSIIVEVCSCADPNYADLPPMQVSVTTVDNEKPDIDLDGTTLKLSGSEWNDQISVRNLGGQLSAQVISFFPDRVDPAIDYFDLSDVTHIEMNGFDGDDVLTAIGVDIPILAFGDEGNDQIVGGLADDILVGGEGSDRIVGNQGDDALFAGFGADIVIDGAGNDLVVSSESFFEFFPVALKEIHAEWTSSRSYEERVTNLTDPENASEDRLNHYAFLIPAEAPEDEGGSIIPDGDPDVLFGDASGQDLFFAELAVDRLLGRRPNEDVFDIPTWP